MSFANDLISDLMSKNVRFKAWGIVDFDNVAKNKIKQEIKQKYKIGDDPFVEDRSFELDISKGGVSKDYLNLPHPFMGVRFTIYGEIPDIEPFGLNKESFDLELLPKGRVRVYLPHSTTRTAQNSFRSYMKNLGYKSVSFTIF